MLKSCEEFTSKVSVLKRLVFSSSVLPLDCPHYWDIVSSFASKSEIDCVTLTPAKAKAFIENLKYLEPETFTCEYDLEKELHAFIGHKKQPLGIILLSPNNTCKICKSSLLVKMDRLKCKTLGLVNHNLARNWTNHQTVGLYIILISHTDALSL